MITFTNKDNHALDTIVKMMDKKNFRSYAGIIEVTRGKYTYTDGYGLIQYYSDDIKLGTQEKDGPLYLDKRLCNAGTIQYPKYETAIRMSDNTISIDVELFQSLMQSIRTKEINGIVMVFDNGVPSLTHHAKATSQCFNPWLIKKFYDVKEKPTSVVIGGTLLAVKYGQSYEAKILGLQNYEVK